jgi:hypothetical protein
MSLQPIVVAACIAAAPAILTLIITFWRDAHSFSRRTRQLDEAKRFAEFAKICAEAIVARADPAIKQGERDGLDSLLAFAAARAAGALRYDVKAVAASGNRTLGWLLFPHWSGSLMSKLVTVVYYYTISTLVILGIMALAVPPAFSQPKVAQTYILFAALSMLVIIAARLVMMFDERNARLLAELKDYGV